MISNRFHHIRIDFNRQRLHDAGDGKHKPVFFILTNDNPLDIFQGTFFYPDPLSDTQKIHRVNWFIHRKGLIDLPEFPHQGLSVGDFDNPSDMIGFQGIMTVGNSAVHKDIPWKDGNEAVTNPVSARLPFLYHGKKVTDGVSEKEIRKNLLPATFHMGDIPGLATIIIGKEVFRKKYIGILVQGNGHKATFQNQVWVW